MFFIKGGSGGLKLLAVISVANLLTLEQFGRYSYIIAFIQVLTLPAALGFAPLLVRQVVIYLADKSWALLRGLLMFTTGLTLFNALIIAAILLLVIDLVEHPILDGGFVPYLIALAALPFLALTRLAGAVLQALNKPVLASFLQESLQPIAFLALIWLVALWLGPVLELSYALAVSSVAAAVAAMVAWRLAGRALPGNIFAVRAETEKKQWLLTALPFAATLTVSHLNLQTDLLLLGLIADDKAVALFSPPKQLVILLSFATFSITAVVQPRIVQLYKDGSLDELQALVTRAARLVVLTVVPAILLLALLGKFLLALYGEAFVAAYPILLILLVGEAVNVLCGLAAVLLNMTYRQHITAIAAVLALAVNVLLNILLIPKFGIFGAAASTASVIILMNVGLVIVAAKQLAINPLAVHWRRKQVGPGAA